MSDVYDVIVVGAGIVGSVLAYALSTLSDDQRRPLNILLLERNLSEPQRIVGELFQPTGVEGLRALGIEDALDNLGAIPVKGYAVIRNGNVVHIPYPAGYEGRSFHHGRFVQSLRAKARSGRGVTVVEATVTDLVECPHTGRILGVKARSKEQEEAVYSADLTVIADGCFSNLRSKIIPDAVARSSMKSHFIGLILEDIQLPYSHHGTVALIPGSGPVLLYQIEKRETRILIDVRDPLPKDLKAHITANIVPHLPSNIQRAVLHAMDTQRLQRMPNTFLPAKQQGAEGHKESCFLIGDAWNMRHPLTGGGMTVGIQDVVLLRRLFKEELMSTAQDRPFEDWEGVSAVLRSWHWSRKPLASTVNILSVALYDLFGASDDDLEILRTGCFKYFQLGGECINGPVCLLSGIKPDPFLLFRHFFAVAFYSIWVLFTQVPDVVDGKTRVRIAGFHEWPLLLFRSFSVFWTAVVVFAPLVWTEVRYW